MGRWWSCLILLVAIHAVPLASAQLPEPTLELDVTPHGRPILPVTDMAEIPFVFTLTCEPGTVIGPEPLRVTLDARTDASWAAVTLKPKEHYFEPAMEACASGTQIEQEGSVSVTVSHEAPVGATVAVTLSATLDDGAPITHTWNETAGPLMNVQTRFDQAIWKVAPGERFELPLKVSNLGNGPVRATVIAAKDTGPLNVTFPGPIEVAAGETGTALLTVQAPYRDGYMDQRDILQVVVSVVMVDDTALVHEQDLTAAIQTQGVDVVESPALGPSALAALALVLALARRRRPA